ncbi:hypothetical protein COB11_02570 [Candidatus Aerophobetes bacterium]|uniref:Uncharacterized protein n=1 Tax=Aerophobetes bacterium TaxID=2030807 RepID=A0A2A4YL32_UNCAE|nr:MAG: hypothetical protein COB11_02570 [Candidatus Aerophobetes bacterium]
MEISTKDGDLYLDSNSTKIKVVDEEKVGIFGKLIGVITGRFTKLRLDIIETNPIMVKGLVSKTVLVDRVSLDEFEKEMKETQGKTELVFDEARVAVTLDLSKTDRSTLFSHHLTLRVKDVNG